MLSQNRMVLPVRIEIDQTGYAKYAETGMYILDEQGNGFDLTPNELHFLKNYRIII